MLRKLVCAVTLSVASIATAATPATAPAALGPIKQIPPPGVTVPEPDQKELQNGVAALDQEIASLRNSLKKTPELLALLPDVQIYSNAVRYALTYNEFFDARQIGQAKVLLKEGMDRAKALHEGQAPWTKAAGLVVKGYVSKIDGSVQPYGLLVPASFAGDAERPRRLDIWYHGRGETLNEINFISSNEKKGAPFAPPDTIMLSPYGRYCNANRFAGEVDTFEALHSVKSQYPIDENRISVRGFSMGGASTWMFATHYPGLWAVAAPGAGFSETAHFLKIDDLNSIPWYQRTLWHEYDSTDYAINLFNCPTVAYSGAIDPQKQAADAMTDALEKVGIRLEHVLGPNTKHAYEPNAKLEVARRVDSIATKGRHPVPFHLKFTTWTLKYNQVHWLRVDGLEHHWEQANVEANITHPLELEITTSNVTALSLSFAPGYCPLDVNHDARVTIDHHELTAPKPMSDRSWEAHFRKANGTWTVVGSIDDGSLRKRHDLQGPIDDAFMDSFVMVKPTGQAMNPKTAAWVAGEMRHAITAWRAQFRGEARVKDDTSIDDNDIANSNLILWGDPSSNAVLKRIADKLPIRWDAKSVMVGDKSYPSQTYVPVMIYPNPLNPKRYVVLNSGFTFREYDYMNNARQTPKLPDWAVVDVSVPASPTAPGGISDAGFFGEQWEFTRGEPNPK